MLAAKKFMAGRRTVTKPGIYHYPYGVVAKAFSPTSNVQIHGGNRATMATIGKEKVFR